MKYQINIANNLITLQPELPRYEAIQSQKPLTINEIAVRLGVAPLLIVVAVVDGAIHPLDKPIERDAKIGLLGPIAGG